MAICELSGACSSSTRQGTSLTNLARVFVVRVVWAEDYVALGASEMLDVVLSTCLQGQSGHTESMRCSDPPHAVM
jgi:hypothetical protein